MNRRVIAALSVLWLIGFPLSAQDPYLSIELSEDLSLFGFSLMKPGDGIGSPPDDLQKVQDLAVEVLLEEARWIFSGMIYGFSFFYVPGADHLEVEDQFNLEPLATISRGDPALHVESVTGDFENIRIHFTYWPDEYQKRRLSRYANTCYRAAGGRGQADIYGEGGRTEAMVQAVKQALREDLRKFHYNRPREVRGVLTLSHPPRIVIGSGQYSSFVRILYLLDDLKNYPAN